MPVFRVYVWTPAGLRALNAINHPDPEQAHAAGKRMIGLQGVTGYAVQARVPIHRIAATMDAVPRSVLHGSCTHQHESIR